MIRTAATLLRRPATLLALIGLLTVSVTNPAYAVPKTGDLITSGTDSNVSPDGAVLRVHPTSGFAEIISSGDLLKTVLGVAVAPSGEIYVTTLNGAVGGFIGVVKVDPTTGAQTAISEGGLLDNPVGIAFNHQGMLVVAGGAGGVVEVDPNSGAQIQLSSGGMLNALSGLIVESDGNIVVTSDDVGSPTRVGLVRVDPLDGSQSLLTTGESGDSYDGVALSLSDDILLGNIGQVLLVDRVTGDRTPVTAGVYLQKYVTGIAPTDDGGLYVATKNPSVGIARIVYVDPAGSQTLIAEQILQGLLEGLWGIAIYPDTSVQTIPTTWGEIKASRR